MRVAIITAAILAIAPNLISAQSDECKKTFLGIIANPDAACLNPGGILTIVTQNGDKSIVPAVDNWLAGFCSAPQCSNDTLAAIVRNVTTGCKTDLAGTGIPEKSDEVIQTLQAVYPGTRKILCLEEYVDYVLMITLCSLRT
jgi:hypothetical protein